jgi:serine/threonine-protein kinase
VRVEAATVVVSGSGTVAVAPPSRAGALAVTEHLEAEPVAVEIRSGAEAPERREPRARRAADSSPGGGSASARGRSRSSSSPSPERRAPASAPVERRARSKEPVREAGFGELSIDAEPWAYVSIGGKALGPTPLAHVRLAAGQHRLLLENPDAAVSRTVPVTIRADERTVLRVRLADGKLVRP